MTGLLLVGGEGPSIGYLRPFVTEVSYVIAADSGLDLARGLGIQPDLIVGDMDSLSDRRLLEEYPKERVILFPADKDETDTEIGLRLLKEKGVDRVILAGGGGGRLDHLLGILLLFERDFYPRVWITAHEHVEIIENRAEYRTSINQLMSFFPIGGCVAGLHSTGLKWPLDGLFWKRGEGGISNRATSSKVTIEVASGRLLMTTALQ